MAARRSRAGRTMMDLTRRDMLTLGATVVGTGVIELANPARAHAQTPKRGRVFRNRGGEPGAGPNPNRSMLEQVEKVEALDRYTVKFTLSEPFAWFLDYLAATVMWIVPREAVEKFGDLRGTGCRIRPSPRRYANGRSRSISFLRRAGASTNRTYRRPSGSSRTPVIPAASRFPWRQPSPGARTTSTISRST